MVFKEDLEFGEKFEYELLNFLQYDKFIKKEGKFKYYDLEIYFNNNLITYEVKADKLMNKTNNICIEYGCFNKPSGITSTKADFWAIFEVKKEGYDLYIIPTKDIIDKINKKEYNKVVNGGDYSKSKMFLFSKEKFSMYKVLK